MELDNAAQPLLKPVRTMHSSRNVNHSVLLVLYTQVNKGTHLSRDEGPCKDEGSMSDLCGLRGNYQVLDGQPDRLDCMLEEGGRGGRGRRSIINLNTPLDDWRTYLF